MEVSLKTLDDLFDVDLDEILPSTIGVASVRSVRLGMEYSGKMPHDHVSSVRFLGPIMCGVKCSRTL